MAKWRVSPSVRKKEYVEYINGPKWKKLRLTILERDNYTCFKCKSKDNLHVHHLRYPSILGTEETCDLITLCKSCHDAVHGKKKTKKKKRTPKPRKPTTWADMSEQQKANFLRVPSPQGRKPLYSREEAIASKYIIRKLIVQAKKEELLA
jgi:hypothetical protein